MNDSVDAFTEPTLQWALQEVAALLFDSGYPLLEEKARSIGTRDEILALTVVAGRWNHHRERVRHLVQLASTHLRTHRHVTEQYMKWGSALAPPIIVHELEEAGTGLLRSMDELLSIMAHLHGGRIGHADG